MIDLYDVKQYNTYDFVQDTLPATDGTWLCSLTATIYTRGHSYNVVSGVATRIEEQQDNLILASVQSTIKTVFDWLNNPFYVRRALQENIDFTGRYDDDTFFPIDLWRKWSAYQADTNEYTFASNGEITGVEDGTFIVGDLVNIEGGLRNNVTGYVTATTSTSITIDNPDIKAVTQNAVIFLSDIPKAVEQSVAQMLYWDTFEREFSDKQSENIGNYSYQKGTMKVGDLEYPTSVVSKLNTYRRVNYVA